MTDPTAVFAAKAEELEIEREEAATKAADDVTLMTLVAEYVEVDERVRDLEEVLSEWKKKRDTLRKDTIPAKMRDLGIVVNDKGSFTSPHGTVYLETREYIGVPKEKEDEFKQWLLNNGHEADQFWKEALDHSVLKGFVESCRDANEAIPSLVTIHQETTMRIRGLASRKKK